MKHILFILMTLSFTTTFTQSSNDECIEGNDKAEDTYRLDYSGTGVITIKAVQELKNENDTLKKKLKPHKIS